ncbi:MULTISPECIES: hypothetical protein [unclassified Mesorhizobium]|uniref:hypothetical protein n=1 Tax=unclassified Mesorhizobium TaxID=325217 RepID=UPI000BAFBDBE|nr:MULTISPECIES: hypothetical protein [unclassified Mesorhizobium]PBB23286.1 hypothetical protein CK232_28690 [Mesorhizobium sp. WSM4304]PBB71857.1 hypothetical protein CK227_29975 [Mesorhizobium sp. WSM4308]
MRNNSTIAVFAAGYVFVFILLLTMKAMFVPSNAAADCNNVVCLAYRVLSEFQTLLAAGVALIAAMPVWHQIKKMNVQQDIMAREIIERRLDSIETKSRYLNNSTTELLQGIWRTIYDLNDDEAEYHPSSVKPEWAFNIRQHADHIASELGRHQIAKADTLRIEAARAKVIDALEALSDCAANISAPAEYAGDPMVSDDDMQRMQDALPGALERFPQCADAVEKAAKEFTAIAGAESASVRDRLRGIAEQLIRNHND